MKYKKHLKIGLGILIAIFILLNVAIIAQAYSLSHFDENARPLTLDYKPTFFESVKIAVSGLDLARPRTKTYPLQPYDSLRIPAGEGRLLDAWLLHTDTLKRGLVIAFHGYIDEKSSMLDRAEVFLDMGYDVLLVNFMGAGDSYGNQTTLGYLEAENVKFAHSYAVSQLQEENIILIGFSMGAVAIMKAQADYNLLVKALVLEAPYATFQETVNARLDKLQMPHFPISKMFTFWFGKINGFDAFEANPQDYAQKIQVPVLLMCGGKDPNIPESETERIFSRLLSKHKELKIFPDSPHESYLLKYGDEWCNVVSYFVNNLEKMNVYSE
ncbi:alpha/beta hydrolase family protein [Dysgonomonas termitidis]|uniref:Alpha/beta hydrolase family protein n=1 Tax=Dysgonomonas termitidis TaxID=1516126 RepID=A0ABV9KQ85_9BACT